MRKILAKSFFNRHVLKVAPELLGKFLVLKQKGKELAFKITEVEAYNGEKDLANHASKGKTKRNEVMYQEAGVFYIYLIYGMYHMLNVVTGKKNDPSAVLIRGVKEISGPGKLTKKLNINKSFNGKSAEKETGLWFEDRGEKISKKDFIKTHRIGVNYAGPIWSKKPYRFILKN